MSQNDTEPTSLNCNNFYLSYSGHHLFTVVHVIKLLYSCKMFQTSPKRRKATFLIATLVSRVYSMKLDIKTRCLLKDIAYLRIALKGTIPSLSLVRIVFTISDTNYIDIPCHTHICVFGFILAHWMLLSVFTVQCTVCAAQTISINDTAPVCHKLCGNGRKKLLSDWKNEIYLFAFHFSFLMWELLLGKWVVYKHHFRGEKLNTDDRHVSNLPTPILDISI